MANPQNLKPWPKGVSGNPGGRPKKRPISDAYEAQGNQIMPAELCKALKMRRGSTYAEGVARAQFIKGIKGEASNAKEVREAIEGKATQRIELTSGEGGLDIRVTYVKPKPRKADS